MSNEHPQTIITRLTKQLQSKQLEVTSLLEVTQAINNNLSSSSLFKIYEFILRSQMGVEKMVVFVLHEEWDCVICYGVDEALQKMDVEKHLVPYEKQIDFSEHPSEVAELKEFDILIPVHHKDKPLSYALVGGLKDEILISKSEKIKFIQTITNIILVAIENKRLFNQQLEQEGLKRELELAAQVQNMLIPDTLPNDENITFSAIYSPHKEVGGDYYDVMWLNDEELVFCVADISGKGIAAAILMANFQANIRALIKQKLSLEIFVHLLNENVTHITKGEKFITFFLAKYNVSNRMFTYVNAGHNPPLMLTKNEITRLDKGCTILGMFDHIPVIQVGEMVLKEDVMIVCYTDGLTDTENEKEEFYEIERLEEFVLDHKKEDPEEFNANLFTRLIEFKGKMAFTDDITILTSRIN